MKSKGWYGDRARHGLASRGIRSKNLKASGRKIYRLYDIDDETGEEYTEAYGTIEEVVEAFENWIADRIDFLDEDEIEDLRDFRKNPIKWLKNSRNGEIYYDWYIEEIYETKEE